MSFITVKWFNDQFNVNLSTAEGKEEFLSIKGCRIMSGKDGDFVSYPATKNASTGKYWNHACGSDKFNAVVLSKANAAKPKEPSRAKGPAAGEDDDIPY
jgi:hypothetical protein